MEKVKNGRIKIQLKARNIRLPGRAIDLANYDWRFTDKEKKWIQNNLKDSASEEKIKAFIDHLERLCAIKKELLEQPKKVDLRIRHERVLKDFKKVLMHLKAIERGDMRLWYENTVSHYGDVEPLESRSYLFPWDAIPAIEEYIRVLEENPAEAKMPKQPADNDHFESEIVNVLIKDIGLKPTSDINNAFFSIVQTVRNILGMKGYVDPSKTIEAVLRKIRLGHPI